MTLDQLIPYAINIATKKGQNIQRLLQPKFNKTKYGRELRRQTREGYLSQAQETNILNKVGTTAGNQANVSTNKYLGRMYNQGMEGSVALNRALREADQDVRRQVTDTAKGIYMDEERAKRDAKIAYAQALDKDKVERRGAMFQVATGIGDAYADYKGLETRGAKREKLEADYKMAQEYLLKNKPEDIDDNTLDMLIKMIESYQNFMAGSQ